MNTPRTPMELLHILANTEVDTGTIQMWSKEILERERKREAIRYGRFTPYPTRYYIPDEDQRLEAQRKWFKDTASKLDGGQIDTLIGLIRNGPLWDGDVLSKTSRDDLLDLGLCCKIIVSGLARPKVCYAYSKPPPLIPPDEHVHYYSEGYQSATSLGGAVYRALLELKPHLR